MTREVLPNAIAPIVVEGAIRVSYAILLAASLGFLGPGPPAAAPRLGADGERGASFHRVCTLDGAVSLVGYRFARHRHQSLRRRPDPWAGTGPTLGRNELAVHNARHNDRTPVLEVEDLHIRYGAGEHAVRAVRGVSLHIRRGETLGIVGESGCGKSTLAFAIMRYLGTAGRIARGDIRLGGESLLALSDSQLRALRGKRLAMVYQDPQTALNPAIVVGEQVAEVYREHERVSRDIAWARALELFRRVGLPDPERIVQRYPHQLSGGQQQRVVIALGLVCSPKLLILDEPTTGLDVTTEATILDLVNDLKREFDSAVLFISHNLGVIAQVCDRVAVMYAGEVVEAGTVGALFRQPRHPYTAGLLGCVPRISGGAGARLDAIPGSLPPPHVRLPGCAFAPRCQLARAQCVEARPQLAAVSDVNRSRCHFWEETPTLRRRPAADSPAAEAAEATAPAAAAKGPPLLEVRGLSHYYNYRKPSGSRLGRLWQAIRRRRQRPVKAVERVSLRVRAGETVALVGESGCGKSTLGSVVAGLPGPYVRHHCFRGAEHLCHRAAARSGVAAPPADGLPKPGGLAQSAPHGWPYTHPPPNVVQRRSGRRGAPAGRGAAGIGASECQLLRPLSQPAEWRREAARRHCPRLCREPQAGDLRRAGVGARRIGAGCGPQSAPGFAD